MPGRERITAARPIIYCVVPRELAPRLHEILRRHFQHDGSVEVLVEQREQDRRTGPDRRANQPEPVASERRRIRDLAGRRGGERRAAAMIVDGRELPRRARRFAEQLVFIERVEPSGTAAEDADTARIVARIQAGDRDAFALLYARYFDRVYAYLRVVFKQAHDAEDATQQVFIRVLEALPSYQPTSVPFRAWFFTVVRNHALNEVTRRSRSWPVEPNVLERSRSHAPAAVDETVLGWLSDRELLLFVERLPVAQRQVLVLRYLLDLPLAQIATILGRSHEDVRQMHARAMAFLRERLAAVGRTTHQRQSDKIRMRRTLTQMPVLRVRRFSLIS
jgi:RNA polymerase sigma-70 factor (ECF subfamily)